jgi:hypothetical protein
MNMVLRNLRDERQSEIEDSGFLNGGLMHAAGFPARLVRYGV